MREGSVTDDRDGLVVARRVLAILEGTALTLLFILMRNLRWGENRPGLGASLDGPLVLDPMRREEVV